MFNLSMILMFLKQTLTYSTTTDCVVHLLKLVFFSWIRLKNCLMYRYIGQVVLYVHVNNHQLVLSLLITVICIHHHHHHHPIHNKILLRFSFVQSNNIIHSANCKQTNKQINKMEIGKFNNTTTTTTSIGFSYIVIFF